MAILSSTGFYGFLCSCVKQGASYVATFVSGVAGWCIKNNGEAEFKSIYARDKIVTNEYVYNRIRVTEDEEVITSNGKILSAVDNEDGTYTVSLDLREGDINPFSYGDLLQGYYHSPGNTGVIYALQHLMVVDDINAENQSMMVFCQDSSHPYKHMIIVRVGNEIDPDRQSFIKISSRTNCQYFFDGIDSFAALDNPDHVKCTLGKADMGLIPTWASAAIGNVKKWFGLIADGVILRGTFILKNDKTIEDELNDQVTELAGRFEIRESGITGKWEETVTAAGEVAESEKKVTKMVSDFQVTAEHLTTEFSKTVTMATTDATGAVNTAKESAVSSLQLTADDFKLDFGKTVETATTDATGAITTATETATSSLNRTAEGLIETFEKSFTDADGEIIEKIKTEVTQNAKSWKVEVMGTDVEGNPNKILAAINASEEGIQIDGDKVRITGELIAEIIKASGLNINDNFIVHESGEVEFVGSLTSSLNGCKVVIKPGTEAIKLIDSKGRTSMIIDFVENAVYSIPRILSYAYDSSDQVTGGVQVAGGMIQITTKASGELSQFAHIGSIDGSSPYFYINPNLLPTSVSSAAKGGLYRDGNMLMIRVN